MIFKNGGVAGIRSTSEAELANLTLFAQMDARLMTVRNALRNGDEIAGEW